MAITNTSPNHDSYPALGLLEELVIGCDSIQKGVAQLLPGNRNKISLRRFYADGDNITARFSTFAAGTIADAMTKDEKQIILSEIQMIDNFDPQAFAIDTKDLWPAGTQASSSVSPTLNAAIRSVLTKNFNATLEKMLWQGDTGGSGSLALMDGFIKKIDADASVVSVTPAGAITAANVIAILEAVVAACPAAVQELSSPAIVTSHTTKYLYRQALRDADIYKGVNFDARGYDVFGGYPIISVSGIPANRVFMFNTGGEGAELKIGLWDDGDRFNIQFGKGHELDDVIGVRIRGDIGVQHVYGAQIVEYSPA